MKLWKSAGVSGPIWMSSSYSICRAHTCKHTSLFMVMEFSFVSGVFSHLGKDKLFNNWYRVSYLCAWKMKLDSPPDSSFHQNRPEMVQKFKIFWHSLKKKCRLFQEKQQQQHTNTHMNVCVYTRTWSVCARPYESRAGKNMDECFSISGM